MKSYKSVASEILCGCLIFIVFLVIISPMAYLVIYGYIGSCTSAQALTTRCVLLEVRRIPHVIDESGCYIVRNQLVSLQYGTAALEIAAGVTAEIEFEDGNDIVVGRGAIGVLVHSAATAHIHNLYCNGFYNGGGMCVLAYNASIEMFNTEILHVRCGIVRDMGSLSLKNARSIAGEHEISYFLMQFIPDSISHDVSYTTCLDSVVSYPKCNTLSLGEGFYREFIDEDGFIRNIPLTCDVLGCCDDRALPIFPVNEIIIPTK